MKKILLKSLVWFLVAWLGSVLILGMMGTDLTSEAIQASKGYLALGLFVGYMCSLIPDILQLKK
jgi:lipopolysaccharide export LptBFGC system permease protein LptF